jgi:dTDP-L-rhamnose 4-epimerase
MNILITGGAGFIGSHTADKLVTLGHNVRILDALRHPIHLKGFPKYLDKTKVEFIFGDVRDRSVLEFALTGIDVVYHLAAYQDYLPDYATFTHINAYSTSLIYEIIEQKKLPVRKVIVASSQAVMGEGRYLCEEHGFFYPNIRSDNQLQLKEWNHLCPVCKKALVLQKSDETVINPQNPYAMSKYMQEMLAINLGRRIGIPSVAMRYSIVQGPRQSFYNTYSGACRIFSLCNYLKKRPTIYEDGMMLRDYVNVHDVVDANVMVMEKSEADFNVFNVGAGQTWTVNEFAGIVASVFNTEIGTTMPGEYRYGDTRHIFSDTAKLQSLGWKPQRTIRDSVAEYKTYLEGQLDIEDIVDFAEKNMRSLGVIRKAIV